MKKINKKRLLLVIGIIVVVLIILILLFKVIFKKSDDPTKMVKDYYKSYIKLSDDVVDNIKYTFDDKLSDAQLKKFKEVVKFQYRELEYTINEKSFTDDYGTISTEINVVDLNSCYDKGNAYILAYPKKFKNDVAKIDYKIEAMDKCEEDISYNIVFNFYKEKGKWVMKNPTKADIQKISGTFGSDDSI